MPELDGFQVVRAIRSASRRRGAPARHRLDRALAERGPREVPAAGMDEYLTKPFKAADLWAAIDRVLKPPSAPQPPRLDLLDPQVLLAACGGDPTMLQKMCRSLQARVPEHLAAVREALQDHDAPRLREAAHKFCGMLSAFSTVAGNQAADLEDVAAGAQLDKAPPILAQLETIAGELLQQVDGVSVEDLRHHAECSRANPTRHWSLRATVRCGRPVCPCWPQGKVACIGQCGVGRIVAAAAAGPGEDVLLSVAGGFRAAVKSAGMQFPLGREVGAMNDDRTTAVVRRYLDDLAGDSPAEPIVRALMDRAVRRLHLLCARLLYRSYPRLTQPPLNLEADELLGAVAERLLKAHARSPPPDRARVLRPGQPAHALGTQ